MLFLFLVRENTRKFDFSFFENKFLKFALSYKEKIHEKIKSEVFLSFKKLNFEIVDNFSLKFTSFYLQNLFSYKYSPNTKFKLGYFLAYDNVGLILG